MSAINIAVLVSGSGTNLQSLIDHVESGYINGQVVLVVSSNEKAYALQRCKNHGIESVYIGKKKYPDDDLRNDKVLELLQDKNVDLVVLAGYMNIINEKMVKKYRNRIINIHPSLIPSFCGKGFYGKRVHQSVLDYGAKVTGATVHFVDEGTDTGPIILQKCVPVKEDDTVDVLADRVLKVEHELLPKAVKLFAQGKISVQGRKVRIGGFKND